jgi:hypothetical protein
MANREQQRVKTAEALVALAGQIGPQLATGGQARSMLTDWLGADGVALRPEVDLLAGAATRGVPTMLNQDPDTGAARAHQLLVAEGTVDDDGASWAVATWSAALDVIGNAPLEVTMPAPGWWMATDGRWYPPEQHPDRQVTDATVAPADRRPSAATNIFRSVVMVAGIVMVLGAGLMPWFEASGGSGVTNSIRGIENDTNTWIVGDFGDGWLLLVIGLLAIGVGLYLPRAQHELRNRLRVGLMVAAGVGLAWLVASNQNIHSKLDQVVGNFNLAIGAGFWLAGLGCIGVGVGAFLLSREPWWGEEPPPRS